MLDLRLGKYSGWLLVENHWVRASEGATCDEALDRALAFSVSHFSRPLRLVALAADLDPPDDAPLGQTGFFAQPPFVSPLSN